MLNDTLMHLKAEFVCEVLDVGAVHSTWCFRHLQEDRYPQALLAFEKLVIAVRAAAPEMAAIRKMVDDDKLMKDAAAEYRGDRRRRPISRQLDEKVADKKVRQSAGPLKTDGGSEGRSTCATLQEAS